MMASAQMTDEAFEKGKLKSAKPLLWIGIASIVMLFAGLTSAYVVRMAQGDWLVFEMPSTFTFSTVAIILSSLTMSLAQSAIKKDNQAKTKLMLGATLLLGLIFGLLQFMAWGDLVSQGVVFAGSEANASGSFLYVLSGLHLAHMAGGIISLLITYYKANKGKYSSENTLGIDLCAIYWHFLDGLWVYLFLFLVFIN